MVGGGTGVWWVSLLNRDRAGGGFGGEGCGLWRLALSSTRDDHDR